MSKYSNLDRMPRGAQPELRYKVAKAVAVVSLVAYLASVVKDAADDHFIGAEVPEYVHEIDKAIQQSREIHNQENENE